MNKILVIDDEKEVRNTYKNFLNELSFENITFAEDGLDAYGKCQLQKFDIILVDYTMPYLNGADFLTALRNKTGLNQQTPAIMVSAYMPNLLEAIKSLDNTILMEKPFDFNRLHRYMKISLKSVHQ